MILDYNDFEDMCDELERLEVDLLESRVKNSRLVEALEKIADPRKRDHSEPDAYTELGCVMNIANEALKEFNNE